MRSATLTQRDDARRRAVAASQDEKVPSGAVFTVWLVHYSLVEPALTPEQIDRLPQSALEQLFRGALTVNGLDKEVAARMDQYFRGGPGQEHALQAVPGDGADAFRAAG